MQFKLSYQPTTSPDALIVPIAQQADLEAVLKLVSAKTEVPTDLIFSDFKAAAKEVQALYFNEDGKAKRIYLLGLGEAPRSIDILNAFRSFFFKRKANLPASLGISFLHENAPENPSVWLEASVNGLLLGLYDIGLYKTNKKP
jgi:leucyl aminopeptidase